MMGGVDLDVDAQSAAVVGPNGVPLTERHTDPEALTRALDALIDELRALRRTIPHRMAEARQPDIPATPWDELLATIGLPRAGASWRGRLAIHLVETARAWAAMPSPRPWREVCPPEVLAGAALDRMRPNRFFIRREFAVCSLDPGADARLTLLALVLAEPAPDAGDAPASTPRPLGRFVRHLFRVDWYGRRSALMVLYQRQEDPYGLPSRVCPADQWPEQREARAIALAAAALACLDVSQPPAAIVAQVHALAAAREGE